METGTRLVFSGAESRRILDTFQQFRVPNRQVRYYYLRRIYPDVAEASQALKAFDFVLVDTGLVYHKFKSEPEKREYLSEYYEYVMNLDPKSYSAVVAPIDLDMDKQLDSDKLIYNLEDLEDFLEGDLKSIFSNTDYLGISSKVANDVDRMSVLCSLASKSGTKLHTFGVASKQVLKKWPIYSSNTSSWRTGSRYANTYIYEGVGRGLRLYQPTDKGDLAKTDREKKNWRTRQKSAVETKQPNLHTLIDWEAAIELDDSWEVDKANLSQWILYQRDLSLEISNAYWLTQDQKDKLVELKKELYGTPTPTTRDEPVELRQEEVLEGEVVLESTSLEVDKPRQGRLTKVDERIVQPRQCDSCILANRCPKYTPGAPCAYGIVDAYQVEQLDDHISEDIADLLQMQKDRIMQGYLEEKADGAGLSKDVSREIKTYAEIVNLYKTATDTRDSLKIEAKGSGILSMFNKPKE